MRRLASSPTLSAKNGFAGSGYQGISSSPEALPKTRSAAARTPSRPPPPPPPLGSARQPHPKSPIPGPPSSEDNATGSSWPRGGRTRKVPIAIQTSGGRASPTVAAGSLRPLPFSANRRVTISGGNGDLKTRKPPPPPPPRRKSMSAQCKARNRRKSQSSASSPSGDAAARNNAAVSIQGDSLVSATGSSNCNNHVVNTMKPESSPNATKPEYSFNTSQGIGSSPLPTNRVVPHSTGACTEGGIGNNALVPGTGSSTNGDIHVYGSPGSSLHTEGAALPHIDPLASQKIGFDVTERAESAKSNTRQLPNSKKKRGMLRGILPGNRKGHQVFQMAYTDTQGDFGFYTGEVDDDSKPHGKGKMKYDNGIFYEGKWIHGHKDDSNGQKGHFQDSSLTRERIMGGFTSWKGQRKDPKTGSSDTGQFVYGMDWVDRAGLCGKYTGHVDEDGVPDGKGIMRYEFGLVAEGDWIKGALNDGTRTGGLAAASIAGGGATVTPDGGVSVAPGGGASAAPGGGMSVAPGMSVGGGAASVVSGLGMVSITGAAANMMRTMGVGYPPVGHSPYYAGAHAGQSMAASHYNPVGAAGNASGGFGPNGMMMGHHAVAGAAGFANIPR